MSVWICVWLSASAADRPADASTEVLSVERASADAGRSRVETVAKVRGRLATCIAVYCRRM